MRKAIGMLLLLLIALSFSVPTASAASEIQAFEMILSKIQLDKPLTDASFLQPVRALNQGEQRFVGSYQNWQVQATLKESSGLVKSFGVSREGSDMLEELLPFISAIYGNNCQYSTKSPQNRTYIWPLGEFKYVNLFYQSGVVRFGGGYR